MCWWPTAVRRSGESSPRARAVGRGRGKGGSQAGLGCKCRLAHSFFNHHHHRSANHYHRRRRRRRRRSCGRHRQRWATQSATHVHMYKAPRYTHRTHSARSHSRICRHTHTYGEHVWLCQLRGRLGALLISSLIVTEELSSHTHAPYSLCHCLSVAATALFAAQLCEVGEYLWRVSRVGPGCVNQRIRSSGNQIKSKQAVKRSASSNLTNIYIFFFKYHRNATRPIEIIFTKNEPRNLFKFLQLFFFYTSD